MKNWILKGTLAAVIEIAMLSVQPLVAAADGIHVEVMSSPLVFTDGNPGTCDPMTFFPIKGQPFCIDSLTATTALSGDFVGSALEEFSVFSYADGSTNYTDYESWTGTLTGHGTGSFILLESGVQQADGSSTSKVRIVNGTGSGDLVGITGKGSFSSATVRDAGPGVIKMTLEFPAQQ